MLNIPRTYRCPYNVNKPMNNPGNMYNTYDMHQSSYPADMPNRPDPYNQYSNQYTSYENPTMPGIPMRVTDYGPEPFVINIEEATKQNNNFRTAIWTGNHLQVTLMSIKVGEDIGLEIHPNVDQFLRVEQGQGLVRMGRRKDMLDFQAYVRDGFAIMVPAGTWHNVINTGNIPLKLYSIYAPPQHPHGTVHVTKADAQAAE